MITKQSRKRVEKRAREMVAGMTLEQKVHIMSANDTLNDYMLGTKQNKRYNEEPYVAGGCEEIGLSPIRFCDGPRGVCCGNSTCFPVSVARGATFNPELEEQVGRAIGAEVRACGGNFFAGVCLNIPYHPGGGRSQETYSEDSYHIGEMGAALVRGIQYQNVVACIKHFAFNSMECSRFKVNVVADKRTEREIYLPHFKRCIDEGAAALMSAYNKYKGEFCGQNTYLLRDVVKGEWKFEGPVMSDFLLGVHDTKKGIVGGLDIEMRICRVYSLENVREELEKGEITMEQIDEAAYRIVSMLLALEIEEDPQEYPKTLIACRNHTALAKRVAEEAITLIQNQGLLPLDLQNTHNIVLVGDLANEENIGDHGSSQVVPPYVVTFYQGIRKNYPTVGCRWIPTAEAEKQKDTIRDADAVILVCGCRHCDEGEFMPQRTMDRGGDRESLALRDVDLKLIHQVADWNKRMAVILMGGNVLLTHEWKEKVNAILMAYYPGMEGGNALARILFGDVNPSGKLPFAIAADEKAYPEIIWDTDYQEYGYYHGYHKLNHDRAEVDYPFGFGLSYTEFSIKEFALKEADDQKAVFEARVKNEGHRAGAEVVQLYIGWKDSKVERPMRTLKGFRKVFLEPSEEKTVMLSVRKENLAYYDEKSGRWEEEDIIYMAWIGTDEMECTRRGMEFRFCEKGGAST